MKTQTIKWFRKLFSAMNEGGMWFHPDSGSIYIVSNNEKAITLVMGGGVNAFLRECITGAGYSCR